MSDEKKSEIAAMAAQIKAVAEAVAKIPATNLGSGLGDGVEARRVETAERKEAQGIGLARTMAIHALALLDRRPALQIAKERAEHHRGYLPIVKALSAGDLAGGGALVPIEFAAEHVELLRNETAVRSMGCPTVPVPTGLLNMGRMDSGATATYIGEGTSIPKSQPAFGQLQFSAKKLAVLVPVSNDLLRRAPAAAEEWIRQEVVARAAVREDLAFLRGDGSASTPRGILNWTASGNKTATAGTTTANVCQDLATIRRKLKNANTPMRNPGWIFSPRTEEYLFMMRDAAGGFLFQASMLLGMLLGWKYKATNQVPENLGGGANESEIYGGDFSEFVIGDTMSAQVAAFDGAAYLDSSTMKSGVSLDETVIRLISEHDTLAKHTGSFAMTTGVLYGT